MATHHVMIDIQDIRLAVYKIIAEALGIKPEAITDETPIPASNLRFVLDKLAHSYGFVIRYTKAYYTAGQLVDAVLP